MGINASLNLIKVGDVVQLRTANGVSAWVDYKSIKDDADRREALNLVQRIGGRHRIIRRGADARVVLTY
jgi:hypothetical protein